MLYIAFAGKVGGGGGGLQPPRPLGSAAHGIVPQLISFIECGAYAVKLKRLPKVFSTKGNVNFYCFERTLGLVFITQQGSQKSLRSLCPSFKCAIRIIAFVSFVLSRSQGEGGHSLIKVTGEPTLKAFT